MKFCAGFCSTVAGDEYIAVQRQSSLFNKESPIYLLLSHYQTEKKSFSLFSFCLSSFLSFFLPFIDSFFHNYFSLANKSASTAQPLAYSNQFIAINKNYHYSKSTQLKTCSTFKSPFACTQQHTHTHKHLSITILFLCVRVYTLLTARLPRKNIACVCVRVYFSR